MEKFKEVEKYRAHNMSGIYDYFLESSEDGSRWQVSCYEVDQEETLTEQWIVDSKLVGYKDNNPNREIREPFTEETAREEFARWVR